MSEYKLTLKGIHHVYGNKADDETEAIKHIDLNVRDLLVIIKIRREIMELDFVDNKNEEVEK